MWRITWTILLLCKGKESREDFSWFVCGFEDIDGNVIESWEGVRLQCLSVTNDGNVFAADAQKRISSYKFDSLTDQQM
jgi:hypothetical protein